METGSAVIIFIFLIVICYIIYDSIPSKYTKLEVNFGGFTNKSLVRFEYEKSPLNTFVDLFRLCPPPPPNLVGAYYLHPPDARAINLHNDLLCKGTCSVTGGCITYWGAQTEKIHFCFWWNWYRQYIF